VNKKYICLSFLFFMISFLTAQDLCPANGIDVFGGDMQNIVSWGEPVGNIGCGDFAIDELPFTHQYNNTGMGDDWLVSGSQGEDVAYTLNVSETATYTFNLCSEFTDYDTKIEIFTNDPDCATPVSTGNYNDDGPFGTCTESPAPYTPSYLENISLTPGQYYVVVDGFGGATGNYEISVSVTGRNGGEFTGNTIKDAWPLEQLKMAEQGYSQGEIDSFTEIVYDPARYAHQTNSTRDIPEECGTFSTYRVYNAADSSLIGETTELSYTHASLTNGQEYCYYVTVVYDEGESEGTDTECGTPASWVAAPPTNLYAEVWDEEVSLYWTSPDVMVLGVPYEEGFDEGGLLDLWLVDGGDNWFWNDFAGNPTPCFQFNWSPTATNYDQSLYAPTIPLGDLTDVTVSFDWEFSNFSATGLEFLSIEYKTGTDAEWTVLEEFANTGENFSFTNFSYDVTGLTDIIQVRFHCYGATTFDINWYYIDNFSVTSSSGRTSRNEYDFLGYNVYLDGTLDNDSVIDSTNYTVFNLSNEIEYTFGVSAVYEGGTGEDNYESDTMSVTAQPIYVFGDVTGVIYDPNGVLMDSVIVSSGGASDTTGTDGAYTLWNLNTGINAVTARRSGFYTSTLDVDVLAQADPTVQDFVLSPDMPRPLGLTADAGDELVHLSWHTPGGMELYELFYDDGVHESSITGGSDQIELAVFFNPNVSGEVVQGRIMFTDIDGWGYTSDPVEIRVYTTSQTEPPVLVYTGEELMEVSELDVWLDYEFPAPIPVDEEGFLLGFRFTTGAGPGIARDETGYVLDHSYVNFGDNVWQETGYIGFPGNFMIRAVAALDGEPEGTQERHLTVLSGGSQVSAIIDHENTGGFEYSEGNITVQPRVLSGNRTREDVLDEYKVYGLDSLENETLVATTTDTFTTIAVSPNYQEYCYHVRAVWTTEDYGVLESRASNQACTVPYTLGDADFDSDADITDVLAVVDFILEEVTPSDDQFRNVDANMDEAINIADVVMIVDIIFGGTARQAGFDADEIAYVDLLTDYENSQLKLDIEYSGPVRGLQFELSYDPQMVILEAPSLMEIQENVILSYVVKEPGILKVIAADIDGGAIERSENTILNIPMEFRGQARDVSQVSMDEIALAGANGDLVKYIARTSHSEVNMIPASFALHQNYPNPFNPKTEIRFDLPEEGMVELAIYNLMGQKIRTLTSNHMTPGYHAIVWDGTNDIGSQVATGMYFYSLSSRTFHSTKKMLYLK